MPHVKRRANAFLILMAMALFALIMIMILIMTIPARADSYRPNQQPTFGTYTQAYLDRAQARRWTELCKGGGRYQAMSEAYESGKPDPCNKN